jgi:hypothetical protein
MTGSAQEPLARFRVRAGLLVNKRAQAALAVAGLVLLKLPYIWGRLLLVTPLAWWLLPLLALCVLNLLWPTTVTVGQDGVLVASLVRRRFYPLAALASVRETAWGVLLTLKSGREVEIRTEHKESAERSQRRAAITACIERRLAELAPSEQPAPATLLARGGRDVTEWLRALHALRNGEAGAYRAAAIPEEVLWRTVEDPASNPTARAGAAVALRESLDEAGRVRLRVAAAASASPRLRVALEKVASPADEAELAGALEGCEEPTSEGKPGVIV